ncbi:sporulation histidine kinase inhibitor Sda [Ammoniphilus sp. 3BR4]
MFYWKIIDDNKLMNIYHEAVNLKLDDNFIKLLTDEIEQRSIKHLLNVCS